MALLPWRRLPYTQHLHSSPASSFSLIHKAPRDQGNQDIKQLHSDPLFPLGPVTHERPQGDSPGVEEGKGLCSPVYQLQDTG